MALGDCFPSELINTTDLLIERPTFSADYGDDSSPSTVASGLSAIVASKGPNTASTRESNNREPTSEEPSIFATIILDPTVAPSDLRPKDRVTFSDFYGTVTDGEVVLVERVSGVDGLESVVLQVGRRG